jgi:hypothetical protein
MAVASSLATTLSLVPLRQASFSYSPKPSFLSFSLLFPNLSLRASRAPSPRLYATPPDSDEYEPEEEVDEEDEDDFAVPPPGGFDALTGFEGDGVEDDEEDYEEGDEVTEAESTTMEVCSFLFFFVGFLFFYSLYYIEFVPS